MNPACDPTLNRPVPSTGERPPFMPVKCDRCGHTHNLHGDCVSDLALAMTPSGIRQIREVETGKIEPFQFNSLQISHLPQKIDGETEHLFIAALNGKVVASVTARIWSDKSCGVRRMFVAPANRGMGIATKLLTQVEILARQERATHLEISCNRGNINARRFWIQRKFIDDPERDAQPDPIRFICMVKTL